MVPGSFAARTENGHQVEDLVEDTFVMLLEDLDPEENTFVTITTFRPNGWEAVISLRADGSYQSSGMTRSADGTRFGSRPIPTPSSAICSDGSPTEGDPRR